jgi:hypothetical protein
MVLIPQALHAFCHWPPWCNTNPRQEEEMIRHLYFSHYRGIREAAVTSITVGAALLIAYFILLAGA